MDPSVFRIRAEDIEEVLAQTGDINASRVVFGADGELAEIHVLALPTKHPKQLVRDIETTIMARFGIEVDHRIISIAQLSQDALDDQTETVVAPTRPRIAAINANVNGVTASAEVTLEIDGRPFIGRAEGPASRTGRARQVALAALDAVDRFLCATASFALEDVTIVHLGRERVAVACVVHVSGYGEQSLTGSALVHQNESDSIVRATLDAINRRMGLLKTE